LQEAISIARKYGKEKEIVESIRLIIASMFFDAQRIQKFREKEELEFVKKSELDEHFFNLDVM
jgi:hypothetical protein